MLGSGAAEIRPAQRMSDEDKGSKMARQTPIVTEAAVQRDDKEHGTTQGTACQPRLEKRTYLQLPAPSLTWSCGKFNSNTVFIVHRQMHLFNLYRHTHIKENKSDFQALTSQQTLLEFSFLIRQHSL